MKKTPRALFIEELIVNAQRSIWKNELAIAYSEAGLSTTVTPLNIEATKDIIKRDGEYIEFLNKQLIHESNQ